MEAPDKAENIAAVDHLKNNWNQLNDVDRALAVHKIHQAGGTFRALAGALHCSPNLLRQLDVAAQASEADRALARQKKISTRELTRRGKAAIAAQIAAQAEAERQSLDRKHRKMAEQISTKIDDWLAKEGITESRAESILQEARRKLAAAEAGHSLPPASLMPPKHIPLEQIVERMRPQRAPDNTFLDAGWYAEWLVRWVYFALPDSNSRHHALGLALARQT